MCCSLPITLNAHRKKRRFVTDFFLPNTSKATSLAWFEVLHPIYDKISFLTTRSFYLVLAAWPNPNHDVILPEMLIKHGYERTLAEAEDDHMPVLVIVAGDAHMYRIGKIGHILGVSSLGHRRSRVRLVYPNQHLWLMQALGSKFESEGARRGLSRTQDEQ